MANTDLNVKSHPSSGLGMIGGAFLWVWDYLVFLGENSARARVVRQINSMSDEQLAERGLTRAEVAKRLLSDGYHM